MLHQVRLYLLVCADEHLDHIRPNRVLHPRRRRRDQPLDVEVVGVDEEADHRHLVIRLVGDVGHDHDPLFLRIRIQARRKRVDSGLLGTEVRSGAACQRRGDEQSADRAVHGWLCSPERQYGSSRPILVELDLHARCVRQLLIERFAIPQTPTKELRPLRHTWKRVALLGKQPPQIGMVPAQLVSGAVAMRPDSGTETLDLGHECLSIEIRQILIHFQPSIRSLYARRPFEAS